MITMCKPAEIFWLFQFQEPWYACPFHSWVADYWFESFDYWKVWGILPCYVSL